MFSNSIENIVKLFSQNFFKINTFKVNINFGHNLQGLN